MIHLEQNKNIAKEEITEGEPSACRNRGASTTFLALIFLQLGSVSCPSWHIAFRTRLPKLPRVKIFLLKLTFAAAVLTVALCLNIRAGHAGLYGDSPWCAVTDDGGRVVWECEYETVAACRPAVLAGNRALLRAQSLLPPQPLEHNPEKWAGGSEKIMLKQQAIAKR